MPPEEHERSRVLPDNFRTSRDKKPQQTGIGPTSEEQKMRKKDKESEKPVVIPAPKLYPNGDCFNIEIADGHAQYFMCAYLGDVAASAVGCCRAEGAVGTKLQFKFNNLGWLEGHPVAEKTYKVIVIAQNDDGSIKSSPSSFEFQAKAAPAVQVETPRPLVSVAEALEATESTKPVAQAEPAQTTTPPVITPPAAVLEVKLPAVEPVLPPTPVPLPAQPPADKEAPLSEVLLTALKELNQELDAALYKFMADGFVPAEAFLKWCSVRLETVERRLRGYLKHHPGAEDNCEYAGVVEQKEATIAKLENLKKIRADKAPTPVAQPAKPSKGGDPREAIRRALEGKPSSQPATAPKISDVEAVARLRAIQAHPEQTTPTQPDLSGRVHAIEKDVAGLRTDLDKKASTEELTKVKQELGHKVDGLRDEFRTGNGQTSSELNALMRAVEGLKPATPPASGGTPPPPPVVQHFYYPPSKNDGSGKGADNNGGKASASSTKRTWWENTKGPVCFLAFILGLLALVGLIMTLYFHASRNQTMDADRTDAAGTKAQAAAEIEQTRRLQMEIVDRYNAHSQEMEGMRRQMQKAPSQPQPPQPAPVEKPDAGTVVNITVHNTVMAPPSQPAVQPLVERYSATTHSLAMSHRGQKAKPASRTVGWYTPTALAFVETSPIAEDGSPGEGLTYVDDTAPYGYGPEAH